MLNTYPYSLTTFCPTGHMLQLDYAIVAVSKATPSVGILTPHGVVLAAEIEDKSILYEKNVVYHVEKIAENIGMTFSGIEPDFRVLVNASRKVAIANYKNTKELICVKQLVKKVSRMMQNFTQAGGVRPFGVSLLTCGRKDNAPYLYSVDPSGAFLVCKAAAFGRNASTKLEFLEKSYCPDMSIESAVQLAISALKKDYIGEMCHDHIQIGILDDSTFKTLEPDAIKSYLSKSSSSV